MTPAEIANLTVALIALLVAVASLLYAWRAFALQRHSSSSSGLHFLHVERAEKRKEEAPPGLEYHTARPYFVSQILSRGPGLRYGARGAVWGEGEFKVITPQVQVWGPGDPGIEFELKPGQDDQWKDVYCGVMWESPRMFRKGFETHGYRVKSELPGSGGNHDLVAEQWIARKKAWRSLKVGRVVEDDPLASAAKKGASFSQQLGERHPDFDLLADLKRAMSAGGE